MFNVAESQSATVHVGESKSADVHVVDSQPADGHLPQIQPADVRVAKSQPADSQVPEIVDNHVNKLSLDPVRGTSGNISPVAASPPPTLRFVSIQQKKRRSLSSAGQVITVRKNNVQSV